MRNYGQELLIWYLRVWYFFKIPLSGNKNWPVYIRILGSMTLCTPDDCIHEACIFSDSIATEIRDIGAELDNCTSEISHIIIDLRSCKIILLTYQ